MPGQTLGSLGKLSILFNNARVLLRKKIEETTLADWERIMGVNTTGVYLGTKYAISAMKDNGELWSIIKRALPTARWVKQACWLTARPRGP